FHPLREHRQVFRVNPGEDLLEGHDHRRIKLEYPTELVRECELVGVDAPRERASRAYSRTLGEKHFLALEALLGPLTVLDVNVDSVPSDDAAVLIAQRVGAEQEPAIFAIAATQPCLRLAGRARDEKCFPGLREPRQIVRMDRIRPPPPLQPLERDT